MKSFLRTTLFGLVAVLASAQPMPAHGQVFAKGGATGLGARALGMGGAFAAVANESSAVYWNPAGLTELIRAEAQAMGAAILNGKVLNGFITTMVPFGDSMVAGLSSEVRAHTGNTKSTAIMYLATFATPLNLEKTFSFGVNFKYITVSSKTLSEYKANGWGADVGFLFRIPLNVAKIGKELRFGLKVEDMSTSIQWANGLREKFPTLIRLGTALKFNETLLMAVDIETFAGRNLGGSKNDKLHMGLEGYFFQGHLGLRMGYSGFSTLPGRYSMGLSYGSTSWEIHYALLGHPGNLGSSHRVSALFRFGPALFSEPYSFIPQGVRTELNGSHLYLIWEKDAKLNLGGWNVYISEYPGGPPSKYNKSPIKNNFLPLVNLPPQQKFYFTVSAMTANLDIESEKSREIEVIPSQILAAPEMIAREEEAVISFGWTQIPPNVTGINVYVSEFKDERGIRVNSTPIKTNRITITRKHYAGLKVGRKYFISLTSVMSSNGVHIEGPPSDPRAKLAIPKAVMVP